MSEPIRLQKFLSQAGVAARRKAEILITEGRVKVNHKVVTELGTKVRPGRDQVEVDGQHVSRASKLYYYLLNKPKGCVTTLSDPQGRPTVMNYLPEDLAQKVRPVGRLDFYTEGVLLFTNDGDLHSALLAPRSHVEKTYHCKVDGEIDNETLSKLRKGVRLDDGRDTLPAQIDRLVAQGSNASSKHSWLVITIREGQSRQIHRMMEAVGHTVLKLARVAFGGLNYFGVRVGEGRYLTVDEVQELKKLVGLATGEDEVDDRPIGSGPAKRRVEYKPPNVIAKEAREEAREQAAREERRASRPAPRGGRPGERDSRGPRPSHPPGRGPRGERPAPRGERPAPRGERPAPRGERPAPRGERPDSRGPRGPRGPQSRPERVSGRGTPARGGRSGPPRRGGR